MSDVTTSALSRWRTDAGELWRSREVAEALAVRRFDKLAEDLAGVGLPELARLSREASDDEARHEEICRKMGERYGVRARRPLPWTELGPGRLPVLRRTLYSAVALGCLSESINAVLLKRTLDFATDPHAVEATRTLLGDEVRHAQLGWAVLAAVSERGWLAELLPAMFEATAPAAMYARLCKELSSPEHVAHGILAPSVRWEVLVTSCQDVILPGFDHLGIDTTPARTWFENTWSVRIEDAITP